MRWSIALALALAVVIAVAAFTHKERGEAVKVTQADSMDLPKPNQKGVMSVEEALTKRRSVREYKPGPLTLGELSQLLWSAQGLTAGWGGRTAPSAGGTYPLETYAVVGEVEGLEAGVYRYVPQGHRLTKVLSGDVRSSLAEAALGQSMIADAPVTIVIAADYNRTTGRYGNRGVMYVHMEAGHAGENIYLQAEALGLGTVAVGAFNPDDVGRILHLPQEEEAIYMFPVGRV